MRTLEELTEHSLFDDLPELDDCGMQALLDEVEFDALDLVVTSSGFTVAADLVAEIPLLSDLRRATLLEAFPTVSALLSATPQQLAELPGFGPAAVRRVRATLRATVKAA